MLNIEQTDQLIRDMSTYVDKTADSVTYGEMVQIVSAYVAPDDDYRSVDDDQYNIISSSRSRIIENKEVLSPKPLRRTSNLMYKPGVGVVEVIYEEPPLLRLSSDGSNSAGSSDQSLTGSMCSHFSDLETIEESEEEYLRDEDTNDDNNLMPQLDTTIEEEDEEEDQLLEILEEEPKEPDDYVKYYEYLVLQGLSLQGS